MCLGEVVYSQAENKENISTLFLLVSYLGTHVIQIQQEKSKAKKPNLDEFLLGSFHELRWFILV